MIRVNVFNLPKGVKVDFGKIAQALVVAAGSKIPKNGFLNLKFVSSSAMRKLNSETRGIDRVTDVLSFAYLDSGFITPRKEKPEFGEIVIAAPYARARAKEFGWPFANEVSFLFIHGILHILGYDHEKPSDAKKMERLLEKILNRFNLI